MGIRDGYNGLLAPADYPAGRAGAARPQRGARASPTSAAPSSAPPTAATRCATR
ncbi:MAG: hypothetical protein M0C28_37535 [Candidatus Moduliflexus flocculans]|nr:hypothetical protein [Candidatus Moduliflexus flocculans]